jgi:hypothetical protein
MSLDRITAASAVVFDAAKAQILNGPLQEALTLDAADELQHTKLKDELEVEFFKIYPAMQGGKSTFEATFAGFSFFKGLRLNKKQGKEGEKYLTPYALVKRLNFLIRGTSEVAKKHFADVNIRKLLSAYASIFGRDDATLTKFYGVLHGEFLVAKFNIFVGKAFRQFDGTDAVTAATSAAAINKWFFESLEKRKEVTAAHASVKKCQALTFLTEAGVPPARAKVAVGKGAAIKAARAARKAKKAAAGEVGNTTASGASSGDESQKALEKAASNGNFRSVARKTLRKRRGQARNTPPETRGGAPEKPRGGSDV